MLNVVVLMETFGYAFILLVPDFLSQSSPFESKLIKDKPIVSSEFFALIVE
jgi:hypothetical protein